MSTIHSYRIIPTPVSEGTRRLHVDTNDNRVADENDPLLVKMTDDGWQPVEQLDSSVDRFTMEKDYGYWKDTEVSHREGWPWNRKTVVDRPKDGKIDADELSFPEWQRLGNGINGPNRYELGAEIVKDAEGRLTLDEHNQYYGSRRIIGSGDIERQRQYRNDDSNWQVAGSKN